MRELAVCPVCESSQMFPAFSAPTTRNPEEKLWSVYECESCGHQFLNPQPSWEELVPFYSYYVSPNSDDAEREYAVRWNEAARAGVVRGVKIESGMRVLDVGCGLGSFLRVCKDLGAVAQGVEPHAAAANIARNFGCEVLGGTLDEYSKQFPDEKFDLITANHVIEHTPNPRAVLSNMKKHLKSSGFIWISVPNAANPLCRKLQGRWHSSDLPIHLMHFTPDSMVKAGTNAGLGVRRQYTESPPYAVAATIRQHLRHTWKIPSRVSSRISLIDAAARRYAARIDAACEGEAIITEFVAPN